MKLYLLVLFSVIVVSLTACNSGPDSPKGFSLPKGSIEAGKQAFLRHQCLTCHQLQGLSDDTLIKNEELDIVLGGERTKVTTYAELVTSIINPSHRIATQYQQKDGKDESKSPMRNYNDVMTVTELVDIVAYLQPHYKVKPYEYTNYGRYY